MRASIGQLLLVGAAGALVAWLASTLLSGAAPSETPDVPAAPRPSAVPRAPSAPANPAKALPVAEAGERLSASGTGPEPRVAQPLEPEAAVPPPAAPPPPAVDPLDGTGDAGAAAIGVLPDNGVVDAPQRYPDDPTPVEDLLTAASIWCDFGEGTNHGLRIGDRLTRGGAAWAGGEIEIDLIELDQGSARLKGSLGATGSRKGEVRVRVIADGARIHLMGLLPTGTLQTITIYGDRSPNLGRDAGRHVAVMSRHEPGGFLTYSVQFFGSCE